MRRIVIDRVPIARLGDPVLTYALEYHYEPWHIEQSGEYLTCIRETKEERIARLEKELGIRHLTPEQLRDENIARLEKELGIGNA